MSLKDLLKKQICEMIDAPSSKNDCNVFYLITREVEETIIKISLEKTGYNYLLTAKILGISRGTLYRKIKEFHIEKQKK